MKDTRVVSFSPMHHWTEHNIRVHVFTCVLALQIAHLMRRQARHAGLDMSVRELLSQLAAIGETVLHLPLRPRPAQSPPDDHRTQRPAAAATRDLQPRTVGTAQLGHRRYSRQPHILTCENIRKINLARKLGLSQRI